MLGPLLAGAIGCGARTFGDRTATTLAAGALLASRSTPGLIALRTHAGACGIGPLPVIQDGNTAGPPSFITARLAWNAAPQYDQCEAYAAALERGPAGSSFGHSAKLEPGTYPALPDSGA